MNSHRQKEVLKKYGEIYPDQTLKQIADNTEINISRVFRILNGYEMKLSEYEQFEKAINKRLGIDNNDKSFFELAEKCYKKLSPRHINSIIEEMKLKLLIHRSHGTSTNILDSGDL